MCVVHAIPLQGSDIWIFCSVSPMIQFTIRRYSIHDCLINFWCNLPSYSATRGLLWSHMGWIFYKQHYERIDVIDKEDLDSDPSRSCLQTLSTSNDLIDSQLFDYSMLITASRILYIFSSSTLIMTCTVPLALITSFVIPTAIGGLWNDAAAALVWAGLVARIMSE